MADTGIVESARRSLGSVGALVPNIPFAPQPRVAQQRDAVRRIERAGYRTAWTNEGVGGKDGFAQLAILLAATEHLTFATGVMNMWARPPETSHGGATYLADAFPGRFVLGLGVGFPFQAETVGQEYGRPAHQARLYLERMPTVPPITPQLDAPYATILGANGPYMLAVSRDFADGAIPVIQPPEFTAHARELLGPDKLLVIGVPVIIGEDRESVREAARTFLAGVLHRDGSPYAQSLRRFGYSDNDVAHVSDPLLEAIVGFGTPAEVATAVQAHLDAGADHVRLDPIAPDFESGIALLESLAPVLSAS